MKSFFSTTILIVAGLLLPFANGEKACFGMDQEAAKLDREVLQTEDLWKAGNAREYYSKTKKIAADIKMNSPRGDLDKIAAKLLDSLLSKEAKVEETGLDDLSAMNKLASYLTANTNVTSEDRRINVKLLCKYLGKIRKEIVPNYQPKPVVPNVAPPPGVPGAAGMSPEAIKDPVAKAKYEAAIRENQVNNLENSRQAELRSTETDMSPPVKAYMVETFRVGDISSDSFTQCINNAHLDDKEKEEVVKKIRSR